MPRAYADEVGVCMPRCVGHLAGPVPGDFVRSLRRGRVGCRPGLNSRPPGVLGTDAIGRVSPPGRCCRRGLGTLSASRIRGRTAASPARRGRRAVGTPTGRHSCRRRHRTSRDRSLSPGPVRRGVDRKVHASDLASAVQGAPSCISSSSGNLRASPVERSEPRGVIADEGA